MSLYTLESLKSYPLLAGKLIVVDTSYLIDLTDPTGKFHLPVVNFHSRVSQLNAYFYINFVVRQEFLKRLRKTNMIDAMFTLDQIDPSLNVRYSNIVGQPPRKLSQFNNSYERVFKEHIKLGDAHKVLSSWQGDVVDDALKQEKRTQMNYYNGIISNIFLDKSSDLTRWNNTIRDTGLAPADALIYLFARSIWANAIVTTDVDFVQVSNDIDVFIPSELAVQAHVYNQKPGNVIYDPSKSD